MRRTRRMTSSERWELGLFLSMLMVGCLCFAAILNMQSLPRLFAFAFHSSDAASPSPAASSASIQPIPAQSSLNSVLAPITIPAPMIQLLSPPITQPIQPQITHTSKPASDIRWFGGHKYRFVKTLRLRVTAYSPDSRCCWPYPGTTTASGMSVKTNHGKLVAADTHLIPMHALVAVPGYNSGAPVPVLDRGGAIKGYRLDVLLPQFNEAQNWGTRLLEVKIYMPVD